MKCLDIFKCRALMVLTVILKTMSLLLLLSLGYESNVRAAPLNVLLKKCESYFRAALQKGNSLLGVQEVGLQDLVNLLASGQMKPGFRSTLKDLALLDYNAELKAALGRDSLVGEYDHHYWEVLPVKKQTAGALSYRDVVLKPAVVHSQKEKIKALLQSDDSSKRYAAHNLVPALPKEYMVALEKELKRFNPSNKAELVVFITPRIINQEEAGLVNRDAEGLGI